MPAPGGQHFCFWGHGFPKGIALGCAATSRARSKSRPSDRRLRQGPEPDGARDAPEAAPARAQGLCPHALRGRVNRQGQGPQAL